MSSKTKIVVLRMKEIIYTAIFIGLAIFLILLFFFMFRSEKEAPAPTAESASPAVYAPGVYSASLSLGRQNVNVEVAVSPDRISAVTLVPLSDSVAAMYPLMQPSMVPCPPRSWKASPWRALNIPQAPSIPPWL